MKKINSLASGKETPTLWSQFSEQRFTRSHPFGAIKELNPELFTLLGQTDPKNSGKEFRVKLDVLQRTFRNNLDKAGEFVNLNYKFAESAGDLADLKEYQKGEDIRAVDWKASARTEKILVKQI